MKKYLILVTFITLKILTTDNDFKKEAEKNNKFVLIINLYNEKEKRRIVEYQKCLITNLKHSSIREIHVIYDTLKDDQYTPLLNWLKKQKVTINYTKRGHPTFGFCFDLANQNYPNSKIILSNADVYFNETLKLLENYDLTGKFFALTRWNVLKDDFLRIENNVKSGTSADTWIFETPLPKFINQQIIKLGTFPCEALIAYGANEAGLETLNPCWTIQCCHMHQSNVRHYNSRKVDPLYKMEFNKGRSKLVFPVKLY